MMAQIPEMEELVRGLNDSRNQSSPEVIDAIQKKIQMLQREPIAWHWALDMLNHDEAIMRFYGALTLTIKINADWDIDKIDEDRDLVNHLLQGLVSSYVRLAAIQDVQFVLHKLCTTLVALFQKPSSTWALPVRHLTACTVANHYVTQDAVPELATLLAVNRTLSAAQLRSLLMFPLILSEQEAAIAGLVKEQHVRVRVSNNVSDILRLLHFAAVKLGAVVPEMLLTRSDVYGVNLVSDDQQLLDLTKTVLQTVPLWTSDIRVKEVKAQNGAKESMFDLFRVTVSVFPLLFQQQILAPGVLQSFTALEESSHKLLQSALPNYEEQIVASPQAAVWIEQLLSGDFDPDALIYVNFLEACMSQVDVTSSEYLRRDFYIQILRQVKSLLQCEGAPGIDDTVCQVALEMLTSVIEGFSDWDEPSEFVEPMKGLVRDSCVSALNKIKIPEEELNIKTQTWDADDRAKFQDFRYDVQDYLQNGFSILGDDLVAEITKSIVNITSISELNTFEAGLFGLIAFSDTFNSDAENYDQYLRAVFECEQWRTVVSTESTVPDRVRQMVIKMIGENTGFLQRHTNFLVTSLNFLFMSLHMEFLATAASRAISTLCDIQRSFLTEALPQFMGSLYNVSAIDSDAKHRIYGAVGAIIQALPDEASKLPPLTDIVQRLVCDEVEVEIGPATDSIDAHMKAIDVLQTLAALGRGLRAPSESPINLEYTENATTTFWTRGPGSDIQQLLIQIHNILLERVGDKIDNVLVEAACGFLRSGFTEEHPSPLKFSNPQVLKLLSLYMKPMCPSLDAVFSTASSYLSSVQPNEDDNEFCTLLTMSIQALGEVVSTHEMSNLLLNSDLCTAALGFYTRLLPKWAQTLFQMSQAEDIMGMILETSLTLLEDSDTLPRRTAASFLTALFEASGQSAFTGTLTNGSPSPASTNMTNILRTFSPRIIATIAHLLGGVCARSDIEALSETLKKCILKQPLMCNKLLKDALKDESAVLSPEALRATRPELRARFAAQIEMLRGARRTTEIVREFWIACRGSNFAYVT